MSQPHRRSLNVTLTMIVILASLLTLTLFSPILSSQGRKYTERAVSESNLAVAPVPPDTNEPVTGNVVPRTEPSDRIAALSLLRHAAANGVTHSPNMNPFDLKVTFNASGTLKYTGPGQLTETWLSGQNWRVTESIGNYSLVRLGYSGRIGDQQRVSMIPMRAHMLRNEAMWATGQVNGVAPPGIRTAATQYNGQPVTCILLSGVTGAMAQTQSRLWDENEYCISSASGLLQVHSAAPGTYTVFGYSKNLQFHGKTLPDHLTTYVAGARMIDADLTITDPAVSPDQLTLTQAMIANARSGMALSEGMRIPMNVPGPASLSAIQIAMVHAEIDVNGNVTDMEISAVSDAGLVQSALDAVKQMSFGGGGQSHAYIKVRFVPASQE